MHPSAELGRVIAGRYRLESPIGRGAMGVVWRAHDQLLDREVAVKEVQIAETLTETEQAHAYQRTLREAKTAARLNHPAVVTVYDVAEDSGRPWIVMQLVAAPSLDHVLAASGPLPPRRTAEAGRQLLSALAVAHAAGVLHRDVKPSNVLLGADDRAVLTDFGIATFSGDARLTQTGMVMGSPGFTAPERIRGADASPASDLWSLGATLFAAVEGHGPYARRGEAITTMSAIINEDAPVAISAGPLGRVIAALLSREPEDRPDAATAMRMIGDVLPLLPADAASPACGYAPAAISAVPGARTPAWQPGAGNAAGSGSPEPLSPPAAVAEHAGAAAQASPTRPEPALVDRGSGPPPLPPSQAPPDFSSWYDPSPRGPASYAPQPKSAAGYGPAEGEGTRPYRVQKARRQPGLWWRIGLAALAVIAAAAGAITFMLLRHGTASTPLQGSSPAAAASLPPASLQLTDAINTPAPRALPAGWTTVTRQASGSEAAGFAIGAPSNWTASTSGYQTDLRNPSGTAYIQVDLTPHTFPRDMVAEARYIRTEAVLQGHFPGYGQIGLAPTQVRGTPGAYWKFTWDDNGVTQEALDLLFVLQTPAGPQSYALYFTAPTSIWIAMHPVFDEAAETFAPRT